MKKKKIDGKRVLILVVVGLIVFSFVGSMFASILLLSQPESEVIAPGEDYFQEGVSEEIIEYTSNNLPPPKTVIRNGLGVSGH